MNVLNYVEDRETSEFYPTPAPLARKLIEKIDWRGVRTILEPSAGKGDLLREAARHENAKYRELEVDAIELDANLRAILKHRFSDDAKDEIAKKRAELVKKYGAYEGKSYKTDKHIYIDSKTSTIKEFPDDVQEKLRRLEEEEECFFKGGIRIVHDDFLTYTNYKKYNTIILNPPYKNGDRHLLKALEMQKNGGQIACLLNAETIRNPYTPTRAHLVKLLDEYNADIEYIKNAFTNAERKTDVEVALIYINIPYKKDDGAESIYERMEKARDYDEPVFDECRELEVSDMIKAVINRYKAEIEAGIELIWTYWRMLPYLKSFVSTENEYQRNDPLILLKDDNGSEVTINSYVRSVRLKYWQALLTNQQFVGKLTSKLQLEYRERVTSYAEYDFSEFNIYTLLTEMNAQIRHGVEDEISVMFDRLTEEHCWYEECKKNRHLYNGWKTNKAWKIDKKVILPCYGIYDSCGRPYAYKAIDLLSDIERILNFFDGNMTAEVNLSKRIEDYFERDTTKNIPCKFFDVTFYKKGTVHIVFKCPELIDRFNIYAAQQRGWLPPCYGKKKYKEMDEEEKAVIDSFQGEAGYTKILLKPEYYLASPVSNTEVFLLTGGYEENKTTA